MANWEDVRRTVLALPAVEERLSRGLMQWRVKDRLVVWERPLRKPDLEALGEESSDDPILGARVPDEVAKRALIGSDPMVYFTTPHFDGYPAILVRLDRIELDELEELIVEAWLDRAPRKLARDYLASMGRSRD